METGKCGWEHVLVTWSPCTLTYIVQRVELPRQIVEQRLCGYGLTGDSLHKLSGGISAAVRVYVLREPVTQFVEGSFTELCMQVTQITVGCIVEL